MKSNREYYNERKGEPLTKREKEILILLRDNNWVNIAKKLGISFTTVRNHCTAIYSKMGVINRTQAVVEAIRRGWISLF